LRYLFWDIDGTLLSTGRAGIFAWERAAHEVFGQSVDFAQLKTAGLIDPEIARTISSRFSPVPNDERALNVLRLYEAHLPSCLPLRQGRVLPNVTAILERLKNMERVRSRLLTGNTRAGAAAKLAHYGLSGYFDGGAFSDGCVGRDEVARCAHGLIPAAHRGAALYVIGDTPHDIRCAAAIGARAIGVATGEYSVEELRSCGAWLALAQLPEPDTFLELLA
jgi:phosphoglycolate phosphatase